MLFYIIIGILVFEFLFNNWLSWLNSSSWKEELPEELSAYYDAEKYQEAQQYAKVNKQVSNISQIIGFTLLLVFLLLGGFNFLDQWVSAVSHSSIVRALLFFGFLFLTSEIIGLPFGLYRTFVVEEKFGFNKTGIGTWIGDKIKGYLLTIVIGGGLLAFLTWLYEISGSWFWLIAWIAMTVFTLFITAFYTSWLLPIFNKLSPLEEGGLRSAIEKYAQKVDFPLNNIFIMDASKRSTKANAFFSGIGNRKSIVLYDTLVEKHSEKELVAILAHEVGHYKRKHILKNQIISISYSGLMFLLLGWALSNPSLPNAIGVEYPSFYVGILAFGLLYSPVSTLIGTLMNYLSRKFEYEADAYAKATSDGKALETSLKKMSVDHLSNLQPHPTYVSVYYSHPPLLSRLAALKGLEP